ncbi:MAG: type IV toxin-antitoxin system AbiEi family antitoxin domain-containing protein [bacterium]|nr:type IV toxin-antitoxin system AbiEi family antitoxin domain-containing protein [candidate division KSB1 bacterium]MDH7560416.1 type IV toxin-antitoxin system AbiEi family antitoxin domain-containing protein [bacterium]
MQQLFTQARWIDLLRRGKAILTFVELRRLTGLSGAALRKAVSRLCQAGLLLKLGKGLYVNGLQRTSLEEVASLLYPPAYISCESALFLHGVADQAPHVLTCVTTNKTKAFRTALGEIVYFHIKAPLFFGYGVCDRIFLAEPEKAALDFVYLQRQNGLEPALDEWNWENLSPQKVAEMSPGYPKTVRRHIARFAPPDWDFHGE